MEKRIDKRRLADLGVEGCQPALAVFCETTAAEDADITKAVLQQKIGTNNKAIKEHDQSQGENPPHTILYKKARIAYGAAVKWKRSFGQGDDQPHMNSEATRVGPPIYASRLISCTRCHSAQETKWMQLRTREGFRAIHCQQCRLQQRCSRNTCQCGKIWHHCLIHREDPNLHRSKKAPKMTAEEKARKQMEEQAKGEKLNCKKRKNQENVDPPQVKEHSEAIRIKKGQRRRRNGPRNFNLKAMRSVTTEVKCNPFQLERVRLKQQTPTTEDVENKLPAIDSINKSNVSGPSAVELGDGYRSARSSTAMSKLSKPPIISSRAMQEHNMRKIIEDQAAKRRRAMPTTCSLIPKTHPKASRIYECLNLNPESVKGWGSNQKKAAENGAILRLLHAKSNKEGVPNSTSM